MPHTRWSSRCWWPRRVAATAQPMPAARAADGTLTNAAGMTLYVFDRDAGGKSACNGPCTANWPPLLVFGDAPGHRRLDHHRSRGWRQTMGFQGQAAVHVGEGHEGGGQDG